MPLVTFKVLHDKEKPAPRSAIKATFMRQPYISFMMLILEDRAVTATFDAIQSIRNKYKNDPEIEKFIKSIFCKKNNPVKSGEIGKYLHARDKMLTFDEQCMLADVVEEYDKSIQISERILKKSVREIALQNIPEASEDLLVIIDKVLFAMICCNCAKDYHLEASEKLPNIDIYMRSERMHGTYFERTIPIFDKLAHYITKKQIDFICHEKYSKATACYYNTIHNNERMMAHYKRLGINAETKTDYKINVVDLYKIPSLLTKTN